MKLSPFRIRLPRTRQALRRWLQGFLLLASLLMALSPDLRYYIWTFFEYPFHYKEYKHFGIRIPSGYSIHGIDVSKYQARIDWNRVKQMKVGGIKITFAFIKASEGTWMKDPQFGNNWENARKAGIIRGAYHYFYPDLNPRDQAILFTRMVRLRSGDLPPVVDIEEVRGMSKPQIQRYTLEFLRLLEKGYKVKPILYTNRDFYKNYFMDAQDFKDFRFWIAHYHVADFDMPGDANWHFWQHSDRGNVNGINERVDFDVFKGDTSDFRKICIP
ncbi:MAG: glycoside hydrolase family 25 protein [Bacteroidetes bacterium]|nr:glycoside hydrolase family 25 protein [Bacteroidota bacterium]